jgi:alanine dehydrogenase
MTLLLTKTEAARLLDLDQAMEVTLAVLREQAAGAVTAIPPRHVPVPRGALRIVSGALLQSRRMGLRAGPAAGLADPTGETTHVALLFDSETGELLCIMGYPFGTLRTGATIGVATRYFARADARTVAMIGTGRNALSLLQAACHVRPIERVRVYSRNAERRGAFAARAEATLGVPVEAAPAPEAATADAAIVYVATDSLTPVLHADWLAPGVFVGSMGRPSELDPSVYLAAHQIVVGDKHHEKQYFDVGRYPHRLLDLVETGQVDWNAVHELCDVVVGRAPARTADDQVIVFKESQGGFGDVAFAGWVYARAREQGLGQEWAVE